MKQYEYVLKYFDNKDMTVTIEEFESSSGKEYFCTYRDKSYCLDEGLSVYEFDTYERALDKAFDILAASIVEESDEQ